MSVDIDGTCSVWEQRQHRARKQHCCDACGETIRIGDVYTAHFDVFEGETRSVKRCARCEIIYQHLLKRCEDPNVSAPDLKLNCGHDYEEVHGVPPPDDIARLAFMTQDEIQAELGRGEP